MSDISGGELLMECLANQGINVIYGIPDGGFNIMFKWMHFHGKERDLRFITPRHEAGGAHMADAMARINGKPGVCMAGAGPGTANLIAGVITAFAENIPMIAITTSRRTDLINPPRGAMQVFDQTATFKPVTKMSALVVSWERIPSLVALAYRTAVSGVPGPVHLDFPEDLLNERRPIASAPAATPPVEGSFSLPAAEQALVAKAADMLVNAKSPFIHCGSAVVKCDAGPELVELAEHLGICVCTSATGRGAIPEDHPLSVPPVAMLARAVLSQADVVLTIGGKFGELDFFGKAPLWSPPEKQKLIHNHISPEVTGLNRRPDVPLAGHAKVVLRQLIDEVKKLTPKRDVLPLAKQCADLVKMGEADTRKKYCSGGTLVTGELVRRVRGFFGRETVFAHDGGNTSLWSAFFNRFYEPRTLLWTGDFGHLGTGLPYAIGAKIAAPEKTVVLISGDGAFGFNMTELETAKREGANIICVVAADCAWGMEKSSQNRVFGTDEYYENCEHSPIRYDKVAEAMGCFGAYVDKAEDVEAALKAAVESGLPAVIHAAVDPVANINPPGADVWVATHSTK